jgi:predicted regulator of Ras-like GTPase activity (Roadblock/LC7/MglB family)
MIEKPNENSSNYREIIQILVNIKKEGKFIGYLFINRNGEILSENVDVIIDSKTFASMCASVLESAVGLGQTVGSKKINKIIAELEEKTVVIVQMSDNKTFITFILGDQSDVSLIDQLDPYI